MGLDCKRDLYEKKEKDKDIPLDANTETMSASRSQKHTQTCATVVGSYLMLMITEIGVCIHIYSLLSTVYHSLHTQTINHWDNMG